jgi:hypothetical protein
MICSTKHLAAVVDRLELRCSADTRVPFQEMCAMRAGKLRMQDIFIRTIDGKILPALKERGCQDSHAGDSEFCLQQVAIRQFPEVIQ